MIQANESYSIQLEKFKDNILTFYDAGKSTFLMKNGTNVSTETFYMHVLRYYLPRIASNAFSIHKCGIGVFTMQGFERRNKESKRYMSLYSTVSIKLLLRSFYCPMCH